MASRRRFLNAIVFLATTAVTQPLFAGRRKIRRRADGLRQPVIDLNRPFADGYRYSDANVEIETPNLAQWQKLRLGMSCGEVKRLLGSPLDGGATTPEAIRAEDIEVFKAQGLTQSQAEEVADNYAARAKEGGTVEARSWTYGSLRFRSHAILDQEFAITFLDDELDCYTDPFSNFVCRDNPATNMLPLDGRPSTPVLVTPNNNTFFEHRPFVVDYRWLPACGVYPMEYVLEVSLAQDVTDGLEEKPTRQWYVSDRLTTAFPFHADLAPGCNPIRWRVKARNRLGESKWSEYGHYQFKV